MELRNFAETVLFGKTLEEKLLAPDLLSDESPGEPIEVPEFPGRPERLARPGKAEFPSIERLHEARARGEILHFFANHELLAFELMALMILRFPDAPAGFRMGVARTIQEEQSHLKLYLSRMKELGVEFGDIPVSEYFWKCMKDMRSPMDFVTQMSLTFEQANLDFSLFFRDAVAQVGDHETAELLDRVYREEIGHVKHGLIWFNRWRDNATQESDWDAYRRLLPPPLTPRRAKGFSFSEEARREAGLSDRFIEELEIFTGAKGRPPILWFYNPHCDAEIARGKPGFNSSEISRRVAQDLEHVPMFLASSQDQVLVERRPGLAWLRAMRDAGFEIPEWGPRDLSKIREPKFGGFQPWGWSPEAFEKFRPLRGRLSYSAGGNAAWAEPFLSQMDFGSTRLSEIFSKSWSVGFFREWLDSHPEDAKSLGCTNSIGSVYRDWIEAHARISARLRQGEALVAKAPWATAGAGVKRVLKPEELDGSLGGWIRKTIEAQGSIVVESWLDKLVDLSIQIEISPRGVRCLEIRPFLTGKQNEYRGTLLGPLKEHLDSASLRLLQETMPTWKRLARDLGMRLRDLGYEGPAGIDAMIYRDLSGVLRLKPLVELNPRWTMGRVALALEEHLLPGARGVWMFFPVRELRVKGFSSAEEFSKYLHQTAPIRLARTPSGVRLAEGALLTQDPEQVLEVVSVLLAGDADSALL